MTVTVEPGSAVPETSFSFDSEMTGAAGALSSAMTASASSLSLPEASVAVAVTSAPAGKVSPGGGVMVNSPSGLDAVVVNSTPSIMTATVEPGSAVPDISLLFKVLRVGAGNEGCTESPPLPLLPPEETAAPIILAPTPPPIMPAIAPAERPSIPAATADSDANTNKGDAAACVVEPTAPAFSSQAMSTSSIESSSLRNKRFGFLSGFSSKNPLIRTTSPSTSSIARSFSTRSSPTISVKLRFKETSTELISARSS